MGYDKFSITLKIKAKHGRIFNYMIENDLTFKDLKELTGIGALTLLKIVNFKWVPTDNYQSRKISEKLCKFFKCCIEDLFPAEIIETIQSNSKVAKLLQNEQIVAKEIALEYLGPHGMSNLLYDPKIDEEIFRKECTQDVQIALKKLTPKEEKVIRMRFGIGYDRDYELEEIGKEFGSSRERIRQIEAGALGKLRHPRRLKRLKEYSTLIL